MTPTPRTRREPTIDELADAAATRNPDPVTRREAFELDLVDRDRSDEGETVEVVEADEADDVTSSSEE